MTNSKTTKRALLTSALAILACVAMLMGATFAWFTDAASTGVNKIVSGNLDVALEMKDDNGDWVSAEGLKLDFVKAEGGEGEQIQWEPGCRYQLPELRVVNKGSLALKYKIVIAGAKDATPGNDTNDLKLLDVIDWTYTVAGETYALGTEKHLAAKITDADSYDTLTIEGHMQEQAGNEYQGLSIEGIAITVYATQDTVEHDSFDNQYDAAATYKMYPQGMTEDSFEQRKVAVDDNGNFYTSFTDAMANVEDGGALYFKEESTIDFPTHLNVTKNVTIYANGADFSGKDISIGTYAAPVNDETTINIYGAKNLVVWGQPTANLSDTCSWNVNFYNCVNDGYNFLMYRGGENATAKINLTLTGCSASGFRDSIVHTTADGSIVIKDCTFTNNCALVNIAHKQAGTMTVTLEDSSFINCGKIDPANDYFAPARFVNNNKNGTLGVTLTNNTFTGTIGTNGDILLGDYRTGKESHKVTAHITTAAPVMVKSSKDAAYSYAGGTIAIPVVEAGSQDELNAAIASNEAGSIKLGEGEYTLPTIAGNKTVTIVGDKDTVIDMTTSGIIGAQNAGLDLTIEGATVKFANDNYKGVTHSKKVTYKDCTITGKQFLYAEEVEFINCTFVQDNADYNIWTYGAGKVLFKDCEFNCKGKAVLIYNEGSRATQTVEFQNCKFTASAPAFGKAAIEIDSYGTSYDVIIDKATADQVEGFGLGSQSNNSVWNVKKLVKPVTVTVDGTVVYSK